jgi:hypothetical protein
MSNKQFFRHAPIALALAASAAFTQSALAHTVLEVASLAEATRGYNNVIIGHACGTKPVMGTSVVFPDRDGSVITANGQPYSGALTDFVSNWGPNISVVQSNELFSDSGVKRGPAGNVVGFWAGGGNVLSTDMIGRVPFRVNATNITPTSCATSVVFRVAIVDVCDITPEAQLQTGDHDGGVVGLWTNTGLGTPYDSTGNNAARLTITRNTTTNPLPPACGVGFAVEVQPSAAQILRDMPIVIGDVQIWPKP